MKIFVKIDGDKLTCTDSIVDGTNNFYEIVAEFSEEWEMVDKFIIFPDCNYGVSFNKDNTVKIDKNVKAKYGLLKMGVYGCNKNGEIIMKTHCIDIEAMEGVDENDVYPPAPNEGTYWEKAVIELFQDETAKKIGGCTWYADTDRVVNSKGEDCGTLAACMTADYTGTWFYVVTSSTDKGVSSYPSQYSIDGANGYLSLRDYVIWTGDRLVHIPTFEAKASTVKNADGKYSPQSGVDGLYPSTAAAYNYDMWCRFIAAHQKSGKNSGYDCTESGLYGNVVKGRPVSVIDTNTPVGSIAAILDFVTGATSQIFLGQTTETANSLHSDLWFKGDSEQAQWLRALTSDNFIRFVNMNYEGYVNWAVAPGIYKVKENAADGDRAFVEEHTMFVIPGAPEPDSDYLAVAQAEDRVKMREHAITQIAKSDATGAVRVRYCPLPNLNRSVSGKCIGWFDLTGERVPDSSVTTSKLANSAVTASKLAKSAVTEQKIANEAVTTDKLGCLNHLKIKDESTGVIYTMKIVDGKINLEVTD